MPSPTRRKTDQPGNTWLWRQYRAYGAYIQLFIGTTLALVAFAVLVVALDVRAQGDAAQQTANDAKQAAFLTCDRTRRFGPVLAADRFPAFLEFYGEPAKARVEYRAYLRLIPKKCSRPTSSEGG